jgi:hypothetical protein
VETDQGKLAMGRQLDQCLVTVRAVSSEASVLLTVLEMILTTGSPPPSSGLTQDALTRQVNGTSLEGNGG